MEYETLIFQWEWIWRQPVPWWLWWWAILCRPRQQVATWYKSELVRVFSCVTCICMVMQMDAWKCCSCGSLNGWITEERNLMDKKKYGQTGSEGLRNKTQDEHKGVWVNLIRPIALWYYVPGHTHQHICVLAFACVSSPYCLLSCPLPLWNKC